MNKGLVSRSFSFGRTVYTVDDETTENGRQIVHNLNGQFEYIRRYMDGGPSAVPVPELVPTEVSLHNSYELWQRTNRRLLAEGNVAATVLARTLSPFATLTAILHYAVCAPVVSPPGRPTWTQVVLRSLACEPDTSFQTQTGWPVFPMLTSM